MRIHSVFYIFHLKSVDSNVLIQAKFLEINLES